MGKTALRFYLKDPRERERERERERADSLSFVSHRSASGLSFP